MACHNYNNDVVVVEMIRQFFKNSIIVASATAGGTGTTTGAGSPSHNHSDRLQLFRLKLQLSGTKGAR